jgi:cytochrome c553
MSKANWLRQTEAWAKLPPAGQHSIYLRQQLLAFRSGKRRHPEMIERARDLTDREIDQLVVYYSTLMPR